MYVWVGHSAPPGFSLLGCGCPVSERKGRCLKRYSNKAKEVMMAWYLFDRLRMLEGKSVCKGWEYPLPFYVSYFIIQNVLKGALQHGVCWGCMCKVEHGVTRCGEVNTKSCRTTVSFRLGRQGRYLQCCIYRYISNRLQVIWIVALEGTPLNVHWTLCSLFYLFCVSFAIFNLSWLKLNVLLNCLVVVKVKMEKTVFQKEKINF